MEERRTPVSLGDRLDVVALVAAAAAAVVLVTNLAFALTADLGDGAAPSPVRQRITLVAEPANLTLGLIVLVGACALAVRRWLNGDHPAPWDALGTLVVTVSGAVALLALVGMFAEVFWHLRGAPWGSRVSAVGEHLAAAALGGLACLLALPGGRFPRRRSERP
jgi:hypothetical protein